MYDLTERLRCNYNGRDFGGPAPQGTVLPTAIMLEAAAEIEKLQAFKVAAMALHQARKERVASKNALRDFRQKNGPCKHEDRETPACWRGEEGPIEGNEECEPWCSVCQASQPLWESYRKAAAMAAAALRTIIALCKKEDKADAAV